MKRRTVLSLEQALALPYATLRFAQRVYRTDKGRGPALLVEANVRVACVDALTRRPRRLPQFLLDAVEVEEGISG